MLCGKRRKQNQDMIRQEITPTRRPLVGVAFGGGALKGTAHIGVMKVLAEHDISVDMVAGTSIGSAIAAMYASGLDWQQMYDAFFGCDIDSLVRVRPSRMGMIPADGYRDMVRAVTGGKRLEELGLPCGIVAVDLVSRKKIVFRRGDTGLAVRASSAIPGVFTPVQLNGMVLVDGYVLDNCPGDVVRQMGADIVIAIDLAYPDNSVPTNMLDVVSRSLSIAAAEFQTIDADVLLQPIDGYKKFMDKQALQECYLLGETCARQHIDEILALLGR